MKDELSNWFKNFSYEAWSRIKLSQKTKRVKTTETTLTENLVHGFFMLSNQFNLPIQLYEAQNERIFGNDLELAIETKNGYILLPTQAKIIKKKGRYDFISHMVRGIFQIELLENYAKKIQGIPLYLFYNYLDGFEFIQERMELEKVIDFDISYYGCSLVKAESIQKFREGTEWRIPTFWDIHPQEGIPMFQILNLIGNNLNACPLFQQGINLENYQLKYYTEEEVTNGIDWKNIAPRQQMGYIPGSKKQKKKNESYLKLFSPNYQPRFRIVISSNPNFNKAKVSAQGLSNF